MGRKRSEHAHCHFGQHRCGTIWNPEIEEFVPFYPMTCKEWDEDSKTAKEIKRAIRQN